VEAARYEGQPPSFGLPGQGDRASAMGFVAGILMALFQRERTGRGGQVASSLFANGIWANGVLAQAALVDSYIGPRPPRMQPRNAITNLYETRDGLWLQISAVREEKMWPALCRALGRPSLAEEPRFAVVASRRRHAAELAAIIAEIVASATRAEWQARLGVENVPNAAIASVAELPGDTQAVAARAIVPADIHDMPRTLAVPFQISGATPRTPGPGPALGEHTDAVLGGIGLSAAEIAELRAKGAIQ